MLRRAAALAIMSAALAASAAQVVTVNGAPAAICSSNPSTIVDAAGNMGITCAAIAATTSVPTPPVATVTVTQPPPTAPPAGCAVSGVRANLTGSYASDTPSISRNGYASYVLPKYTAANIPTTKVGSLTVATAFQVQLVGVNNNVDGQTNPRWGAQFAISTCPGDFTSTPSYCTAWGVPDNGGIVLRGYPAAAMPTGGNNCTMVFGTQYYLNIRFVNSDKVTPSCANGACTLIVEMNSSAKL